MTAPGGCSGSRRRCFTTASPTFPTSCCGPTGGRLCARSLCRRPRRSGFEVALAIVDEIDRQLIALERELARLARRQTGCQALMRQYGVGPVTATTVLCELGDVTRLSASRKAVRCCGLDIGVYRSDRRSRTGRI